MGKRKQWRRKQWDTVIEGWMIKDMKMETVTGISQLLIKRKEDGSIRMILEKSQKIYCLHGLLQT